MEIPKINVPTDTKVDPAPTPTPVVTPGVHPGLTLAPSVSPPPVQRLTRMAQFYIPAFWDVQSEPGSDTIVATNGPTNDVFTGTHKEFVQMLKGS